MRRIVAIIGVPAALGAVVGGTVIYWRRNPRLGTRFMNVVVNPALLRRGLAGGKQSELGTIEHLGRKSGVRRLTLVHPEPTADGFRIMIPLGPHSEWARNVLAAGHCRLQLHEQIYELDEPVILQPSDVGDLPRVVRGIMRALGFQYLGLRTFSVNPGELEPVEAAQPPIPAPAPAPEPPVTEPVSAAG